FDGSLGCWLWRGADRDRVYGRFNLRGRIVQAHRAAWILWRGELADNELVLHHCDVTQCVNFRHLWVGTFSQNSMDAISKGRSRWGENREQAQPWTAEIFLVWFAVHKRRTPAPAVKRDLT